MAEDEPGTRRPFGICWECKGLPSSYFFEGLPTAPQPKYKFHSGFREWKKVRLDCALCSSLKAYLVDSGFISEPNSESAEFTIAEVPDDHSEYLFVVLTLDRINRGGKQIPLYRLQGAQGPAMWFCSTSVAQRVPAELRDLTLAKDWVSKCVRSHEVSCGHMSYDHKGSFKTPLTVIDCASRELREISPETSYVCLSYVWGNSRITEEHAKKIPAVLPKTIEDAIHVTLQLEIAYLWVDRYCINQHDAAEKQRLVTNMDSVYRGATLTIIAAAGDGPDSGLPGIKGTPRGQRYSHVVKSSGQEIISIEVSPEIWTSTWNTRGWTYQEMVLSRRRLVFTATQMYFQCNAESHMEAWSPTESACSDNISDTVPLPRYLTAFHNLTPEPSTEILYAQLIEYYNRRLLFDEDIVKAILGIINAFKMRNGSEWTYAIQIHGLPVFYNRISPKFSLPALDGGDRVELTSKSTFLHSLMWHIHSITRAVNHSRPGIDIYPSWSFASVKARLPWLNAGRLSFGSDLRTYRFEEDLRVWIEGASGTSFELDHDFCTQIQRNHIELLPRVSIMSWVVSCRLLHHNDKGFKFSRCSASGFTSDISLYLDYAHSQEQYSDQILAIYIRDEKSSREYRHAELLLVEKVDDLTWRRIGLLQSGYVKATRSIDIRTFLNRLNPDGAWEIRTLCLV